MNNIEKILSIDAKRINEKIDLSSIRGKKILITGASGLIGINILMSIKKHIEIYPQNVPISVVAIIHSKIPQKIKAAISFKQLKISRGDITNELFLKKIPRADYIFHAAGYGQPAKFIVDKIKTLKLNTNSTIELVKKMNMGGKFVFISSSEIYSGSKKFTHDENDIGTTNTTHPRACYIEGKRCGETICNIYFEKGYAAKSARLALAYGPGTKAGDARVLNSFIEKALKGDIHMMDDGKSKRTYCYVSDAVEIIWNILLKGKKPIYNVGGYSSVTIYSLAKKIAKILHVNVIKPSKSQGMHGAPKNVNLDMSKISSEFNKSKETFVDIEEGLERTISYQREIYK